VRLRANRDDIQQRLRDYAQYQGSWGADDNASLLIAAADELDRLKSFVARLSRVLNDEGPNPLYHRQMINRHSHEWPALWRVLGRLRSSAGTGEGVE